MTHDHHGPELLPTAAQTAAALAPPPGRRGGDLIVDDGGYGILREYMTDTFGEATATELSRPDFVVLPAVLRMFAPTHL